MTLCQRNKVPKQRLLKVLNFGLVEQSLYLHAGLNLKLLASPRQLTGSENSRPSLFCYNLQIDRGLKLGVNFNFRSKSESTAWSKIKTQIESWKVKHSRVNVANFLALNDLCSSTCCRLWALLFHFLYTRSHVTSGNGYKHSQGVHSLDCFSAVHP